MLATAYLRTPARAVGTRRADPLLRIATAAVALALTVGVVRGVLPWPGNEGFAVDPLNGPLNALRIAKGALWAWLACGLWRRLTAGGAQPYRALQFGVVAGLAMTVAVIVWERATFASLLDFAGDYRVTAAFSSMHTGGAYIECFLVVATPFLVKLILEARHWMSKIAGAVLLAATAYALMVTFSRTGQAALAVATAIVLAAWLTKPSNASRRYAWGAGLAVLMVAVAVPVLRGPFAQARTAAAEDDFSARRQHWAEAIALRPDDAITQLFGAGLGRFPETHYWYHNSENRSATYHLYRDPQGPFLRLGSGNAIYVEQFVTIAPARDYILRLNARSHSAG